MHDQYDDEDDGYDDEHYDKDYNDQYDPYKFYFQFDMSNTPLSDWITKMINDIVNKEIDFDKMIVFPVNSWNPNTVNDKFQYLGSNYYKEPIWKSKYWAYNPINNEYKSHIQSNAVHFIKQPSYYKGLFDILN
jgi:hypothetical protein